jgi:hypothetical protein
MGLRPKLCPKGDDQDLPLSSINLSRKEEKALCEFLKSVKVPSGYLANIGRIVLAPDIKIAGKMKSHTCHIMLTTLLAVAIRKILPIKVREKCHEFLLLFQCHSSGHQSIIFSGSTEESHKDSMSP